MTATQFGLQKAGVGDRQLTLHKSRIAASHSVSSSDVRFAISKLPRNDSLAQRRLTAKGTFEVLAKVSYLAGLISFLQGHSLVRLERSGSSTKSCFRLYFVVLSNWYAANPDECWSAVYDFNCTE
jgi:hypothetical protein